MSLKITAENAPQEYAAVYQTVCPKADGRVPSKVFLQLCVAANIDRPIAKTIWDACDSMKRGVLSQDELFRALAFIGLAQAGEEPKDTVLNMRTEPPPIKIGDLSGLRTTLQRSSKYLDYTYRELEEAEFIDVSLAKETGLLMKHTNYSIFSKRKNCTVTRRYSDFEPLDSYLRKVYPYRIIPALPPKSFDNKSPEFVEKRRRGLRRYLTFLGRHPVIRDNEVFNLFLSDKEGDLQARLKERVKVAKEEYFNHPQKQEALQLVPEDIVLRLQGIEAELHPLIAAFDALVVYATKLAEYTTASGNGWREFSSKLKDFGSISSGYLAGHQRWQRIHGMLKDAANLMATVSDRCDEQRLREDDGMVNNLQGFLDVLVGMNDLLKRRSKGLVKEMDVNSRKLSRDMDKLSRSSSSSSQHAMLEAKINQRDSAADDLTQRNNFSLFCIWEESKLVKANFAQIGSLMQELVSSQTTSHRQLAGAWEQVLPVTDKLVAELDAEDVFS